MGERALKYKVTNSYQVLRYKDKWSMGCESQLAWNAHSHLLSGRWFWPV